MTDDRTIETMRYRFFNVPCLVCKGRWGETYGDACNCHTGGKIHKYIPDFSKWLPTVGDIEVAFIERYSAASWAREASLWKLYLAQANGACSDYD